MSAGDVAFQRLLAYVRARSPFYRDKLAGIRAETLADLRSLPFTTKHEIREGGAARVDPSTVRKVRNLSNSDDAVYLVAGGKDGYVGRDGVLPEGETNARGPLANS